MGDPIDRTLPTINTISHGIECLLDSADAKDEAVQAALDQIDGNIHKVDNTPWLRKTGWPKMFAGQDMGTLHALTQLAASNSELEMIATSVVRVITVRCMESIHDLNERNWTLIPFWLNSYDVSKAHEKPFSEHIETKTVEKYAKLWARLLVMCVRVIGMEGEEQRECGVEFTPEQEASFIGLKVYVEGVFVDDDELDTMVLHCSALLCKHDDYAPQRSAIMYFMGILGYDIWSQSWSTPNSYTPKLAAIQLCMRVVLLEHTIPMDGRDTWRESYAASNPVEEFNAVRNVWLVEGVGTPYNRVHKMLVYGMHIAQSSFKGTFYRA